MRKTPQELQANLDWCLKHQPGNTVAIDALKRRLNAGVRAGASLPRQLLADGERLRELWKTKPSTTLWATACRLGLSNEKAEYLVNALTAAGVVRYQGNPFRAEFS